jgi:hypothetical protein
VALSEACQTFCGFWSTGSRRKGTLPQNLWESRLDGVSSFNRIAAARIEMAARPFRVSTGRCFHFLFHPPINGRRSDMNRRLFLGQALGSALMVAGLPGLRSALASARRVNPADINAYEAYKAVVDKTAAMVANPGAQQLAQARQLNILNVTWEDTGRFKDSCVGPNISDMTIQVQLKDPRTAQYHLTCMPVIRFPNFADKSADIDPRQFYLLVGNEKGKALERVNLWQFLGNVRKYLSKPGSWKGDRTSLLAKRDSHVLVSAQACFLPVPKQGSAEFNPVLFNYQSRKDDPAVLTILATREGTSVTVIDNQRDGFQAQGVWGQRLFFNQNGERASLTGQRLSDFTASGSSASGSAEAAGQKGLNMVLLIQVPLKQKKAPAPGLSYDMECCDAVCTMLMAPRERSDVEAAVIGHGKVEGPFTEFADLDVQRDPDFPIRVTVQFYKATSNGVVSAQDMADLRAQIDEIYAKADYVGSLVTEDKTGRPTEYDGDKVEPPDWWENFWQQYEEETGRSRADACAEFRRLRGADWFPMTERQLADEAQGLPPVSPLQKSVERAWQGMSPTGRVVYSTLGVMGAVGTYGLAQRGWRRWIAAGQE